MNDLMTHQSGEAGKRKNGYAEFLRVQADGWPTATGNSEDLNSPDGKLSNEEERRNLVDVVSTTTILGRMGKVVGGADRSRTGE